MKHSHSNIYLTIVICTVFATCTSGADNGTKYRVSSLESSTSSLRSENISLKSDVSWLQYQVKTLKTDMDRLEEKCISH